MPQDHPLTGHPNSPQSRSTTSSAPGAQLQVYGDGRAGGVVRLGRRRHGPAGVRVEPVETTGHLDQPARTPVVPMPSGEFGDEQSAASFPPRSRAVNPGS